jgi:aminocarboxymuconate-semialdehyde decarboxylase
MRAIDTHAHVIVPEMLRDGVPGGEWRPRVRRERDRQLVEFGGRTIASAVEEFVELDGILAAADRACIERVVLCPWVPLLFGELDADEGLRRCRLQNEGLARLRSEKPQRVTVLGAVPVQSPALAARELEDMMASGEFAGVEIAASVGGVYLGDPRFEPFWEAAEQSGALVFIHPTTRGFEAAALADHYLWNLVGNPMETTMTAAHLVLSGTLERHPGLHILLAHAGGAIVTLAGRLRHGHASVPAARQALHEPPDASIRRFYFDSVTHDPAALRTLVQTVGADRVLLGSDYPFDMGDPDPVATVRAAGLAEWAQWAVVRGNAERVLGLAPIAVR